MQEKNKFQIEAGEKVSVSKKKLSLRKKRVKNQNFAMFLLMNSNIGDQETNEWLTVFIVFLFLFAIFILHSRESELYRYTLDGKSALAWELPFSRFMGHLSST